MRHNNKIFIKLLSRYHFFLMNRDPIIHIHEVCTLILSYNFFSITVDIKNGLHIKFMLSQILE